MNYIVHTLTLAMYCWVMFLQVWNLVKYRESNGALKARLILIGICICLTAHTVKRYGDSDIMFYMFLSAIGFMWLYHGFEFKKISRESEKKPSDSA